MSGAPARPFTALFILPSFIGDAIMSSGVIRHMRERHPGMRFTIATSPLAAGLFSDLVGLDRIIAFRKHRLKTHWLALWPKVFRRWDVVVDMRGSIIPYLVPAGRRIVYTSPRKAGGPREHRVIVAARTIGRGDDPPDPLIECSPATEAKARALLAGEGPILAIAPGGSWIGKLWPVERFLAVATTLLNEDQRLRGGRIMLVGGPREDMLTAPLRAALGATRVIDLIGLDLITTFACLRRARLFVGNDSGMMHTAAAAGAPTLGLFGPTRESVFTPWGPANAAVRGSRSHDEIGMERPGFDDTRSHMGDLDVPTVLAAARDVLTRTSPRFADEGGQMAGEPMPSSRAQRGDPLVHAEAPGSPRRYAPRDDGGP